MSWQYIPLDDADDYLTADSIKEKELRGNLKSSVQRYVLGEIFYVVLFRGYCVPSLLLLFIPFIL